MRFEKTGGRCFLCGQEKGFLHGNQCIYCGAAKMESSIVHLLIKYSGGDDRSLKDGKEYLQSKRILNVGPIQGLDADLRGLALYLPVDQQHIMSGKILYARDGLPFDAVCATQVDSLEMAEKLNTVLAQNGILITAEDERIVSGLGEPSLWTIDEDVYGVYHKRVQTAIAFSGERFMPGIEDKKLEAEHMQRYLSVRNLVKGMQVLDLACGEGYGSALLAETAESVIGVDIDQGTIDQAQKKYQKENLRYMEGDAAAIPLPDHSVDAVVSFETIEHISEELQQKFLREINRVLKPDGLVIMSTPNKAIYSDRYSYFNEYHIHEFYPDEFVLFLKQFFPYVRMYQQSFQVVSLLSDCESADGQAFWYGNKVEAGEAKYLIAVASRRKNTLPEMSSLFLETAGEYEEKIQRIVRLQNEETMRNLHIHTLDGELVEKGVLIQRLQTEQAERDAHIQELDQEMAQRVSRILELQDEVTQKNQHIHTLNDELREKDGLIQRMQAEEKESHLHIQRLNAELNEKEKTLEKVAKEKEEISAHMVNAKEAIVQLNKERDQLHNDNGTLQQECSRIASERDHMEEQRNTLAKERDELKGYHQQLKEECEKLHETIKDLNTELNNKKGHIELLLESDRELERIHHSRHWKVMTAYWKVRDFVFPKNSRRRLLVKLAAKFIRHPIGCLKRVDVRHIKTFVDGLKSGSIESTGARLDNYLGGSVGNPDRPNQIPIVEYKTKEDAPHFHVPSSNHPVVSIVIPVYNQFHYTYACLKTIAMNSSDVPYEVIVANDCSTDLTTQLTKIITGVKVVTNKENLRFLKNCNNAAKHARGKYILFLNNDTQVQKNWLSSLVELIERDEKIGMVGSKLVYPDGRLQEAGGIVWRDGSAWNYGNGKDPAMPEYNYVKDVDYISGAAIMIRADLWREIGGFDDQFAPAYYEDTDLSFEVRHHGYRVVYQPLSVVIHFEGVSNGTDTSGGLKAYQVKNQKTFYEKWKDVLQNHKPNAECVFRARERSLNKPVLLFVDHYVPEFDKDAGSRAVFQYIQLFLHRGFLVKFIGDNYFHSLPYTTVLEQMGVEVLCGDWYYMHWKEWLKENAVHFDYAILNRPHIAVNYIDILRQYSKAHIAYFGHDLHYLREMREYETTQDKKYLAESQTWHEKEYALMRKMDVVFYFSTVEIEMIKKENSTINAVSIPVYIFDDVPNEPYRFEKRKDLFFVGGFAHRPNLDAVEWLVSEIMPKVREKIPDIQLHIAGSKMPNEIKELDGKNGFVIEGTVSDERLEELYGHSRIAVVPLRYGAGVKGKVIESMYHGLPLVTTPCGAEGIEGAEDHIVALKTAEEIANKIIALYNDRAALEKLSADQRENVNKYFSEAHAVAIMDKIYHFSGKKENMQ